jgi:small subunit ribosomal protein S8
MRNKSTVRTPASTLRRRVLEVLQDEGYIRGFEHIDDGRSGLLRVELKYGTRGERLINRIDRISKPGCRVYMGSSDLPRPRDGMGIAIVSTSSGVMSDRRARTENVGGEVVAIVD